MRLIARETTSGSKCIAAFLVIRATPQHTMMQLCAMHAGGGMANGMQNGIGLANGVTPAQHIRADSAADHKYDGAVGEDKADDYDAEAGGVPQKGGDGGGMRVTFQVSPSIDWHSRTALL